MHNKKKLLMTLLPIITILVFGGVYFGFTSPSLFALSAEYPTSTLTGPNDFNFLLQTKAIKFENGKWTYHFTWNRTREAEGTMVIAPKVNENVRIAELDPAPRTKTASAPLVVQLDPATRYVFRYYSVPGCNQASIENDIEQECVAIRSIYFNTRDENGKIMTTAEVPLSNGGTKVDTSPTNTGTGVAGIVANLGPDSSVASLQAMINQLMQMVQTLLAQLGNNRTQLVGPPVQTGTITTNVPAPTNSIFNSFNNPTYDGSVYFTVASNDQGYNGARGAPDPVLVKNNDLLGYPTTDYINRYGKPNLTNDQLNKINEHNPLKRNPRIVEAFSSVGRPFLDGFHYYIPFTEKCENNPKLKIEVMQMNLPPGITFTRGADPKYTSYEVGACTYGILKGTASAPGNYLTEFKVTSNLGATPVVTTTRIYITVLKTNVFGVTVGNVTDPSGTTISTPVLGGRASISWNQSNVSGNVQNTNWFEDLEIWVARDNGGTPPNPDNATDKKRVAVLSMNYDGCNNSTRGGGDPLAVGCGTYNWVVGNTTEGNLASGNYLIYVTPWIPYVDKGDRLGSGGVLNKIFENGTIFPFAGTGDMVIYPQSSGYAYGVGKITINPTPSGQTSLLNNNPTGGAFVSASFIKGGIFYTKKNSSGQILKQGSVGVGTGSNSDQAGCNGNWTGGVSCGITVNANPGDVLDLSWHAKDAGGNILGGAWESKAYVSGPFDGGNEAVIQSIKNCTSSWVPGGLTNNESEGFMSSPEGSKTITIPTCLAGKSLYMEYQVWSPTYGGGTGVGGNFHSGLLVINVGLSGNSSSEVVSGATCRLPVAIAGSGKCVKTGDTSYRVDWSDWDANSTPQKISFFAGANKAQVESNCTPPSNCLSLGQNRYLYGKTMSQVNEPFNITGAVKGQTYWNKLVASCGTGGAEETRELIFSCGIDNSGNVVENTGSDWSNNATCVLPAVEDMYNTVTPNFATGLDVTGENVGYSAGINSYMATFNDIRINGAKFDRLTFLVGTSQAAVQSGCASNVSGTCIVNRDVNLSTTATNRRDPNRFNEQYVSGLSKGTEYWNRLIYRCGSNYRDVIWSAATER